MANYTCEEPSICTRFQSAICLHCNRRLCLEHITEHNKIIYNSSITNLSNEVKLTFQQVKEESEKRKDIFNNILTSYNLWKTEQIEKIQQIYDNHLKLIESQREVLNNKEVKLFEQLEQNALQPLEHVKRQQNVNMDIINHIQQTIKQVRKDNSYLKWELAIPPPPIDVEFPPLNILSISLPNDSSKSDNKSTKKKKISSTENVKQSNGHPLKRLVAMFSNVSHLDTARNEIDAYVKSQKRKPFHLLPNFICSYLTAWYRKSRPDEKVLLLNEHITTVQKYITNPKDYFAVLLGIQIFFYNEDVKENKNDMMTFLLQYFLNHQCLDQDQIFKWYNHKGTFRYEGYNKAKQLAQPFIESLLANQKDSTSIDQSYNINIKQEPVAMD